MALLSPQAVSCAASSSSTVAWVSPPRQHAYTSCKSLHECAEELARPSTLQKHVKLSSSAFYSEKILSGDSCSGLGKELHLQKRSAHMFSKVSASDSGVPAVLESSVPDSVVHTPRRIALFVEPSPFA